MRKSISSDIALIICCDRIKILPSNYSTSIFQTLFGISSQALASIPRILRILINFSLFDKSISLSHEPKSSIRLILCFPRKIDFLFNFLRLFSLSQALLFSNSFVAQINLHRNLYPMWFCFREQSVGASQHRHPPQRSHTPFFHNMCSSHTNMYTELLILILSIGHKKTRKNW